MVDIRHFTGDSKGNFTAYVDGKEAGEMSYTLMSESGIIIDHTEVNKLFHGQNIGRTLVLHAVEYAREHHIKILPLCPFAKTVFERDKSLRDVLY